MIIPSSLYGDFPVSVSASLSHKDHSVCSLHSLATMLGYYQRIYGLSVDQICPFELACSFRHDVRHLGFVNPEDTGFEIKKERAQERGGEGQSRIRIAWFFITVICKKIINLK